MTDDERGFIRTICEHPTDITPRLVFADWLEEYHGGMWGDEIARRAAFIRDERPWANSKHLSILRKTLEPFPKSYRIHLVPQPMFLDRPDPASNHYLSHEWTPELTFSATFVRHGFIEQIWINQGAFGTICRHLFENHPVRDVFLTRQDPEAGRPYVQFGWLRVGETVGSWPTNSVASPIWDRIASPKRLWELLGQRYVTFDNRVGAYTALSAACVRWGRELAGLPP